MLPQIVLDVIAERDGLLPAKAEDGLADVLFVLRKNGTVAAMVFVVALAVEVLDKVLLQWTGNAQGHVMVHLCNAKGHADGLVVSVHGTCLGLHHRIVEVDTVRDATVFGYIGEQLRAKTVCSQGACL